MEYKGYNCKLNGVYKVANGKKLYSLEIYKGNNLIYKTDWIYENEKRAFKDAKDMIKENRFDTEIIRRNTNKEIDRSDHTKELAIAKDILNSLIIISLLLLIGCYITLIFFINSEDLFSKLLEIAYIVGGLVTSLGTIFWGLFAKENYTLSDGEQKAYNAIWGLNLLLNKHYLPYREQPFEGVKRTWSSALSLTLLLIMGCFGWALLTLVTGPIRTLIYTVDALLVANYFLVVSWEIVSSILKGESFLYKKVFMPIIAVGIFVLIVVIFMKIAGAN